MYPETNQTDFCVFLLLWVVIYAVFFSPNMKPDALTSTQFLFQNFVQVFHCDPEGKKCFDLRQIFQLNRSFWICKENCKWEILRQASLHWATPKHFRDQKIWLGTGLYELGNIFSLFENKTFRKKVNEAPYFVSPNAFSDWSRRYQSWVCSEWEEGIQILYQNLEVDKSRKRFFLQFYQLPTEMFKEEAVTLHISLGIIFCFPMP